MTAITENQEETQVEGRWLQLKKYSRRNPTVAIGLGLLVIMVLVSFIIPFFIADPLRMNPIMRLRPPSDEIWFATFNTLDIPLITCKLLFFVTQKMSNCRSFTHWYILILF